MRRTFFPSARVDWLGCCYLCFCLGLLTGIVGVRIYYFGV